MAGRIDGISDWVPPILWAALRLSVWRLAWFNYSAARLLHPEIRTYLWTKVCHGWSSKYNVPLGHHWHLENQRSVPHRAADQSYPRSTAPVFYLRSCANDTTLAIVPCAVSKDHCFFDQRYAQKFSVSKAPDWRWINADWLCITKNATGMLLACNKHKQNVRSLWIRF